MSLSYKYLCIIIIYWHTIYLCRYASKNCVFILSHIGGNINKIIIPIIKNSHWTLVVVDFKRKELNSLQGQNEMEYMKRIDLKTNLKVVVISNYFRLHLSHKSNSIS